MGVNKTGAEPVRTVDSSRVGRVDDAAPDLAEQVAAEEVGPAQEWAHPHQADGVEVSEMPEPGRQGGVVFIDEVYDLPAEPFDPGHFIDAASIEDMHRGNIILNGESLTPEVLPESVLQPIDERTDWPERGGSELPATDSESASHDFSALRAHYHPLRASAEMYKHKLYDRGHLRPGVTRDDDAIGFEVLGAHLYGTGSCRGALPPTISEPMLDLPRITVSEIEE
jgi:hypothetical protein